VPAASSEQQPATTSSAASTTGATTKPRRQRAPKLDVLLEVQNLLSGRFFIPRTEVDAFQAQHAIDTERLLEALIQPASLLARTPVSSYNVGCVRLCCTPRLVHAVPVHPVHAWRAVTLTRSTLQGRRAGRKRVHLHRRQPGVCRQAPQQLCKLPRSLPARRLPLLLLRTRPRD
jgi:hypothetical protein